MPRFPTRPRKRAQAVFQGRVEYLRTKQSEASRSGQLPQKSEASFAVELNTAIRKQKLKNSVRGVAALFRRVKLGKEGWLCAERRRECTQVLDRSRTSETPLTGNLRFASQNANRASSPISRAQWKLSAIRYLGIRKT